MKKQNKIFGMIILFIAVAVYFTASDRTIRNPVERNTVFSFTEITSLRLCFGKGHEFAYIKTGHKWFIESPFTGEADSRTVDQFVKGLRELVIDFPISEKRESHPDFELTDESRFIEVSRQGQSPETIIIGKVKDGLLYFRKKSEDRVYSINSRLTNQLPGLDDPWKNKQILQYDRGEIAEVLIEDSNNRVNEIKFKDRRWEVNGYEADQNQVEFLIAGLTSFRADRFPDRSMPLPAEKGSITVKTLKKSERLELYYLPGGDFVLEKGQSLYYLNGYRIVPYLCDPSELYSRDTLVAVRRLRPDIQLGSVIRESKRPDVRLLVTSPASDDLVTGGDGIEIQYAVEGVGLDRITGCHVIFILDGNRPVIRRRGLPLLVKNLSEGAHTVTAAVCAPEGFFFRNSLVKRDFYIRQETEHTLKPFIRIISPQDELNASSGKVLVDFIAGGLADPEKKILHYSVNGTRVRLGSWNPFLLDQIPESEVLLKMQIEDEDGQVLAEDSRKYRFK